MKRLLIVLALLSASLLVPAKSNAQFAVFDGTNYALLGKIWQEDASTGIKMVKELKQLLDIYQTDMAVLQLGQQMAQMMAHPQRAALMMQGPAMFNSVIQSRYGENMDMPSSLNGNTALSSRAWGGNQSISVNPYMSMEKLGQSYLIAKLGRAEQADGANVQCTQVLSDYYNKRQMNKSIVALLDKAGLDISKGANTMIAQLNLDKMEHQHEQTEAQFQGNLQACQVQQQMIANADKRDETVESLNMFADMDAASHSNNAYIAPVYAQVQGYSVY